MRRKTLVPALLSLGLGASFAGCDGATPTSAQEQGGNGEVTSNAGRFHYALGDQPVLNLPDYKQLPTGSGLRIGAASTPPSDRSVDFGLALRTASIKLRGDLPTAAEMAKLSAAVQAGASDGSSNDPYKVYTDIVTSYVNAPTFARQMMHFWRNTLRMGGTTPISAVFQRTTTVKQVNIDTAPAMLAKLTVEGADMTKAFTQATANCPMFDPNTNTFVNNTFTSPASMNCFVTNGMNATMPGGNVPEGQQAGVLTNPGFMAQYFSNMGMRRARLIQELFGCTRMPAEFRDKPEQIGAYLYSSPWPFDSVTSNSTLKTAERDTITNARVYRNAPPAGTKISETVDFAAQCQSCHSTMNHRAAMFAMFDQVGYSSMPEWSAAGPYMVVTPVGFSPFVQLREYLPVGDTPAWRYQKPATTFNGFGMQMAQDPEVQRCFVTRIWNHAYSRDDVVESLALVPPQVTADLVTYFTKNGFNLKATILKLYTDANFIRF